MNTHRLSLRRLVRETVLYIGASPRSRWHQIDTLRALDDRMLRDIGLTRQEAEDEANRPIWDVPTHWRG